MNIFRRLGAGRGLDEVGASVGLNKKAGGPKGRTSQPTKIQKLQNENSCPSTMWGTNDSFIIHLNVMQMDPALCESIDGSSVLEHSQSRGM